MQYLPSFLRLILHSRLKTLWIWLNSIQRTRGASPCSFSARNITGITSPHSSIGRGDTVMLCPDCKVRMVFSHHVEEEKVGIFLVLTNVSMQECPNCSTMIKMISPPAFFQTDLT